jgi:demethylmenaquinone methyltransferase/2-methoxy-6-polyprenyl-1,4-benzoquinol methylase
MRKFGLQVSEQKHYKLLLLDCYWSVLGRKPA